MARSRKNTGKQEHEHHASPLERLPQLAAPAVKVCLATAIAQLRKADSWSRGSGRSAMTIAKYPDLRIVLISMKKGSRMDNHQAEGRISVLTLTGMIRLHLGGTSVELPAGHLLTLERAVPHDVEAVQQSTFLLTIAWAEAGSAAA
jgi:quercetin dioxygenase-like cupin family protein